MIKHQHLSDDKIDAAKKLEKEGKTAEAEKAYLKIINDIPAAYEAYNRLLIIYRKQKEYRKELATVNKAIKAFETEILAKQKQWIKENKETARLSKSLAEKLGVIDKKGLPVSENPVMEKWRKRKEVITKRLKKD
jgi:tetratricopeptide (TPR) repeat protein